MISQVVGKPEVGLPVFTETGNVIGGRIFVLFHVQARPVPHRPSHVETFQDVRLYADDDFDPRHVRLDVAMCEGNAQPLPDRILEVGGVDVVREGSMPDSAAHEDVSRQVRLYSSDRTLPRRPMFLGRTRRVSFPGPRLEAGGTSYLGTV